MSDTQVRGKLPLWPTVRESYGWAFGHIAEVAVKAWPVLAMLAAVSFVIHWLAHPYASVTGSVIGNALTVVVLPAAVIAFGAMIAVPWHRFVLEGEPLPPVRLARSARLVAYFLWAFALAAPFYASIFALSVAFESGATDSSGENFDLKMILTIIAFIVGAYLFVRFGIKLVAVALGDRAVTLANIWRATSWNFWRLFWGGLLAVVPFIVVGGALLVLVPDEGSSRWAYSVANALVTLAEVLLGLVSLTFLSLAYRHFMRTP
jgi:hypothetical protein